MRSLWSSLLASLVLGACTASHSTTDDPSADHILPAGGSLRAYQWGSSSLNVVIPVADTCIHISFSSWSRPGVELDSDSNTLPVSWFDATCADVLIAGGTLGGLSRLRREPPDGWVRLTIGTDYYHDKAIEAALTFPAEGDHPPTVVRVGRQRVVEL